jgi:proline-specific peptidase
METSLAIQEGYVSFRGHKVWYRVVGNDEQPGKLPLLCLHGGPGFPHDYLEPLEAIAATGRRVIFYDQLGCGNSAQPHDPSLWTIGLFVEELSVVRHSLGLERVHLFGQSWGGMLAQEYALTRPGGLASLILADTLASMPQFVVEANRLRAELPPEVQATLSKHETAGTTEDPAYQDAMMVFYGRHICRLDPWPDYVNRSLEKFMQSQEVYGTMWGASEFHVTGTLKDWDITHRLNEIRVPALVLGGRYDEVTPALTGALHSGIADSEWIIFENSAHLPHAEETERYMQVVSSFLDRVESRG